MQLATEKNEQQQNGTAAVLRNLQLNVENESKNKFFFEIIIIDMNDKKQYFLTSR